MAQLMLRPDEARAIQSQLDGLNHHQFAITSSLNNYLDEIQSLWSGEVPAAFTNRLANTRKNAVIITDIMNTYIENLGFAINTLEEADRRLAEEKQREAEARQREEARQRPQSGPGSTTDAPVGAIGNGAASIVAANLNSNFYTRPTNIFPYRYFFDTGRINCTFFAYGRYMERTGNRLTGVTGNAGLWLTQARASGRATGYEVRTNSVAVFTGGGWGHVVFIEDVFRNETGNLMISFSEGNFPPRVCGAIDTMSYDDFIGLRGRPAGYIY